MKDNMNQLSGNRVQTSSTHNITAHIPAPANSKQIPAWQGIQKRIQNFDTAISSKSAIYKTKIGGC